MPLAPGKVLVSPDFVDVNRLPHALRHWDMLVAPKPVPFVFTRPPRREGRGLNDRAQA